MWPLCPDADVCSASCLPASPQLFSSSGAAVAAVAAGYEGRGCSQVNVMHSRVWRATPGSAADNHDQVVANVLRLLRPDQPALNLFLINQWSVLLDSFWMWWACCSVWFYRRGATMPVVLKLHVSVPESKAFAKSLVSLFILRSSWWWIYQWKENLPSPGWTLAKPSVTSR